MPSFDEDKHPRSEDGKFTEKIRGGAPSRETVTAITHTLADLAGNFYGYAKGEKFAAMAFDAALGRWGVTGATRFSRYAIPTLRLASRFILGTAAGTGVGALAAGAALLGVEGYYGFRSWQRSRQGVEGR